jgi:hypothetical protein
MAILKKRTSSKQLPETKGIQRAPLDSVIRGVGSKPSIANSNTSLTSNPSLAPRTSITTSTTPRADTSSSAPLTSTTKPTITSKTSTSPTTKTTSAPTQSRPTVKPNTTKPNSASNQFANALTGAALGAGTKLLIDKFSSKPNVSKTPQQVAAEKAAVKKSSVSDKKAADAKAANTKKSPPVNNKNSSYTGNTKPSTNPNSGSGYTGPKDPTSVVNPPVEDEFMTDKDGNLYQIMPDGSEVLVQKAGTPVEDEFVTDAKGNTYKVMPDGTEVLYRAAEVDEDIDAYPPSTVSPEESLSEGETIVSDIGEDLLDNTFADNSDSQYFQDENGNYYTMNADGGYDLAYYADGSEYSGSYGNDYEDDLLADNNFYDEETDFNYDDYFGLADNSDYTDDYDYLYAGNDDYDYYDYDDYDDYNDYYSDYEYAKRGGLMTMMKQGGIAHMADGGYMPDGAVDNGDGTYSIGRFTYDMMSDEYLYSTDDGVITNVNPDAIYSSDDELEPYYSTDSLGNVFRDGEFYRAAEDNEDLTSAGGGDRSWYDDYVKPIFSGGTRLASDALGGITGALGTTAGAAGAGALIATLLGNDFSGGGDQYAGLDMSKVGAINPRTTDFGIGSTNFVGYDDYGTSGGDYTPNEELLRNLNAPGYNPVNEGDYGYEEVAPQEEAPKMASGGLSSMSTPVASYYTFGQPADILANLGMRPQPPTNPPEMMPQIGQQQQPQQTQQQGLPQQAPPQMMQQAPQGMPQQGIMPQQQGMPPPMRKGGLPRASDVPLVQGRMDFRKGAAVHGEGDGQSDDIPAMLADGEYVIDAETVAQIGNGSTKAGAQALDKFREGIRSHKRSAPINKIPPKTKALTSYLKG